MTPEIVQAIERMDKVTTEKIRENYQLRDELRQAQSERDALLAYVKGKGGILWRKWIEEWIADQK